MQTVIMFAAPLYTKPIYIYYLNLDVGNSIEMKIYLLGQYNLLSQEAPFNWVAVRPWESPDPTLQVAQLFVFLKALLFGQNVSCKNF